MIGSHYISRADLQDYLTTERIRTLLQELFDNTNQSPPHAERVRSNYLRAFAILLAVGYGHMIRHFVEYRELRDKSLPFSTEPEDFPKTSTQNLFEAFYKQQWQFCAVPLEYDMRDDLGDDYILPITAKKKIAGGGSAILYKITVDEEYNKLVPPVENGDPAAESRTPNTFALKTYRTPDAKRYFENERNAFIQLRYGYRPPKNIMEYYGSIVRRGTYSIILEYADRGTLDDYMKNTAEPKTVTEIRSFWENFLASMRGLVQIHGTHQPASDGPNILLGWHHDIDPSNILVVSKGQDSPYDCDFKIADLGLAHFKRYISSLNNATDNDRYGTSTYGAPETFQSTDLEKNHLLVLQSADIWSMGCVYSEAPPPETAKKLGVALLEDHRFHLGSKKLETVDEIHDEIKRNSRRCDLITPCVIENLVKTMVRSRPESRGTASFLLETSTEILRDAKSERKEAIPSVPAPNLDRTVSDPGTDVRRRRLPPNLPPEEIFATEPQPIETRFSISDPEEANDHDWQRRSAPEPNEEGSPQRSQGVRKDSPFNDPGAQDETSRISLTVNNLGLPYSASIYASSTDSDSSETASIASVAWSDSSKSSVSSGSSDALVAGLDETTEFFLSDKELRGLFAQAFTSQSRDKVMRNGVRLLKWLGRRLVVSAKTTIEKEAAEFFLSRSHGRSIMNRIALQISDKPIVKLTQGHIAQHQLQSSMKREKIETHLQQLRDPTNSTPNDFESENTTDSEDEQQIGEEKEKLNLDAAKSFLKSSDALARLKEELGDFISPFSGEAMWKKTLWIGGQQIHFELPETAPQRTRINEMELALEEHLKMPILWWPLKQPRKWLSSNR
ncbi:MAG: hypothetical protein Q9180_002660, partial [Flavoplaca navasiana]